LKTPRRFSLASEITWVLVLKAILLFALWYAFFSGPADDREPSARRVGDVVIGTATTMHSAPAAPLEETKP
jgi:hypothetical protein